MKKVMLVDDEILIRENIRACVDWEKEGFTYCGDASDGEVALPLIEQWMPDILITDIKMPFMNGLELSSIVRQQMPDIKIIILSGHDEFHYAQSALRLGVEDYCLKPVSSADLIQLLQGVSERIDQEQRAKKKFSYTGEKLLSDLCGGLISTAQAIEAASYMNLNLSANYYSVVVFDLRFPNAAQVGEDSLPITKIDSFLNDQLAQSADSFIFKRSRTETVWIHKGNQAETLREKVVQSVNTIHESIEQNFQFDIPVGIGNVHERLQGIHTSYLEAEEDKNGQRISSLNQTSLSSASFDAVVDSVLLDRNRFIEFLKIGTPSEAPTFISEFAAGLVQMNWKSSMYGYYLLNDLSLEMIHTAKQSFQTSQDPTELIEELQQSIKNIADFEGCLNYLTFLLDKLWKWRSEGSDKYGDLIGKVKQYISECYNDDQLSLQDISRQIGVSPSHMSKVFSQVTGQTMTEYLTGTRIRKAMELLKTTRHKTFEIAFEVGYNDQHYFSNQFKKVTGMTPMEYRKQGTADEKGLIDQERHGRKNHERQKA
ncbi:response regulator [Paenibacillus wynnii]|uniref:response regulator n=1 Tax=Paenibacillus wynnii TaxID=268407 RepID=UPI002791885B|nr:response regulator [Paenibacillus wynnii]MDQ0193374.1 two-component system response regulator YesN [Paenibacillus wynnii]